MRFRRAGTEASAVVLSLECHLHQQDYDVGVRCRCLSCRNARPVNNCDARRLAEEAPVATPQLLSAVR